MVEVAPMHPPLSLPTATNLLNLLFVTGCPPSRLPRGLGKLCRVAQR